MKILIATGIFPPHIGGPAQYAKNLQIEFEKLGHEVKVATYTVERKLPTGIRHLFFFFKILPKTFWADAVVALDTFSVGFPAVIAGRIFNKKIVIRTGGDFLWEGYVERTNDLVLLRDFYPTRGVKWNTKERIIFKCVRFTMRHVSAMIWSTRWQKEMCDKFYGLDSRKSFMVENYYGRKSGNFEAKNITFLGATRPLKWKNIARLEHAFKRVRETNSEITLDTKNVPYEEFMEKMQACYVVILVSLGDISPNMILDALRLGKPIILTRENGINDRVKDHVMLVDPENEKEIRGAILAMSKPEVYQEYKKKSENFSFIHGWDEIAREFLAVINRV